MTPYPKTKQLKLAKSVSLPKRRKLIEKQLEQITKYLIAWRDGGQCIQRHQGGCNDSLMWTHLIAQKQSKKLRYDLGNVHWGCGSHNLLERHGDRSYILWFVQTFGVLALEKMQNDKKSKVLPTEREEKLAEYDRLYQNRFTVELDLPSLVKAGYYGSYIREAWITEGKIQA